MTLAPTKPKDRACQCCGKEKARPYLAAGKTWYMCRPCFWKRELILNTLEDEYQAD